MLPPYTMLPVQQVLHPRRSPDPSSPTVAANRIGRVAGTRAATIAPRHRDERGQAARVVRNAGALEPLAAPLHRDVHLGPEHGVEMCGQHDRGGGLVTILSKPSVHVTGVVDRYVGQADLAEQFRHARGAPAFRARGRRDGGERCLAGERHLVGALDVMARRAYALVREQARDGVIHGSSH